MIKKEKKKTMNLTKKNSKFNPFSLMSAKDKVSFYIPYRTMLNSDTLLLKNGGLAKVFEITNFDLNFVDDIQRILDFLNKTIKLVDGSISIHYETQKKIDKLSTENISSFAPLPTVISQYKRNEMLENKTFYKIKHYLTISYFYDFNNENSLDSIVKGKMAPEKEINELLKQFEDKVGDIIDIFNYAIADYKALKDDELVEFLYSTINPLNEKCPVKNVPYGFPLDELLSNSQITIFDGTLLMDNVYTKCISIKTYPKMVRPQIFGELENLSFPFRCVTRMIGLDKEVASKIIKKIQEFQYGKRFSLFQNILNAMNKGETVDNGDENQIRKSFEAKYAKEELDAGYVSYGYHTVTVIVQDKNLEKLKQKVNIIRRLINKNEFVALDDKFNVKEAYFGAMPSNITHNIRKSPMSSSGLSYMLPITTTFQGFNWDERIDAPNILTTLINDQVFYYNNKVGDVGHTMVIGPTGAGKSVFLMTEAINFLKYESLYLDNKGKEQKQGSQLFIFDKGGSSKVLTITCGGSFYNLGSQEDSLSFQPLRNIHITSELEFARDWILGIIEQEDKNLADNVQKKEQIWNALVNLADMEPKFRTISMLVKLIQDDDLKSVLRIYSKEGIYGDYFDGNEDNMSNNNFITFEMENIMEKPKVLSPILEYLFHRIETERLRQGIATRVILDECWIFLKNEKMKEKIQEWLKVFRKQNASVVFATQSLADIENSSISTAIKDACMTKIFLPNEKATSDEYYPIYKNYGLSDITIETISKALPRKEYVYTSTYGIRVFGLALSPLELCYVASSDDYTKTLISNLQKIYLEKYKNDKLEYVKNLNLAYFQNMKNLNKISNNDFELAKSLINNYNIDNKN